MELEFCRKIVIFDIQRIRCIDNRQTVLLVSTCCDNIIRYCYLFQSSADTFAGARTRITDLRNLNFIYTGGDFKYTAYVAVISAIKVQSFDTAILWYYDDIPSGQYVDMITDKVVFKKAKHNVILPQAATKWSYHKQRAVIKDGLSWFLLWEVGGIFLDLDTLSIKEIPETGKDLTIGLDIEEDKFCINPFNNAIVIGKAKTPVTEAFYRLSESKSLDANFRWGDSGPRMMTNLVNKYRDSIAIFKYGIFGYGGHKVKQKLFSSGEINPSAIILHGFATFSGSLFDNITAENIKKDTVYANTVRTVLEEHEWNV